MANRHATAQALQRRYPGVLVEVEWVDLDAQYGWDGQPDYKGWRIDFKAADPKVLVRYGLATIEDFEPAAEVPADEFGHRRHAHGIMDSTRLYSTSVHIPDFIPEGFHTERRAHTKKMQRAVSGLLRRAFALPPRSEAQS